MGSKKKKQAKTATIELQSRRRGKPTNFQVFKSEKEGGKEGGS